MESTFRKEGNLRILSRASWIYMINIITFISVHEHWCLLILMFFWRDHFHRHLTSIKSETVARNRIHVWGSLNFQVWSSYACSRGRQVRWPTNGCLLHQAWMPTFRHVWFGVLPTLLKMTGSCDGQQPTCKNIWFLLKVLMIFYKLQIKLGNIVLFQIETNSNNTCTYLFLNIKESPSQVTGPYKDTTWYHGGSSFESLEPMGLSVVTKGNNHENHRQHL